MGFDGDVDKTYDYDAYGNELQRDLNDENPFRYCGEYYDTETGFIYLRARYYDPATGRFVAMDTHWNPSNAIYGDNPIKTSNAEDCESLYPSINAIKQSINLYAYCMNDPVNGVDSNGKWTLSNLAKFAIGAAVIAGLGIATVLTGGAAAGVAGFILAGAFKGAVIGAVSGALISGAVGGISSARNGGDFWSGVADGAATGFMSGSIFGAITGAASNAFKVFKASKLWNGVNGKNVTRTPYQDMVKHYQRHVIEEGQKEVAKNIVKYSNDAKAFYMNNSSNVIRLPSGAYKIPGAPGGIYSESGKILSFWYIGK